MQKKKVFLVVVFLMLATYGAFRDTLNCGFITAYDDAIYITENTHISSGLSLGNVRWALTAVYASNWHPLTWISHMLDIDLFGMAPYGHHLVSLFFHIADSLLLFLIFSRTTGRFWASAFVAFLFALHPARIESVVWVAERKDVLSTFFAFLTIHAYIGYSKRKTPGIYALVILLFSCALASKPMVVTLPFILLLMDIWPLDRFGRGLEIKWAIVEKIPLLVLSLLAGIMTLEAQKSAGALDLSSGLSLADRLSHSFSSYVDYILLLLRPFGLSAYYPFPESISVFSGAISLLILAVVTWIFYRAFDYGSSGRYLIVGWLWFIVSLFPVVGFVQAGAQGMADRYTYFPSIGMFLIAVFGCADLSANRPALKPFYLACAFAVITLFYTLTVKNVPFWRDSITLFERAVRVTKRNIHGHHNLGVAYSAAGRTDDAIQQYEKVLEIRSGDALAHHNLGLAYMRKGRVGKAVYHFREALKADPGQALTRFNLALGLIELKDFSAAVTELEKSVALQPDFKYAYFKLGAVEQIRGNYREARKYLSRAVQLDPHFTEALINLGNILEDVYNDNDGALSNYNAALTASPESAEAHNSIGIVLAKKGRIREAGAHFEAAVRLNPGYDDARRNLSRVKGGAAR